MLELWLSANQFDINLIILNILQYFKRALALKKRYISRLVSKKLLNMQPVCHGYVSSTEPLEWTLPLWQGGGKHCSTSTAASNKLDVGLTLFILCHGTGQCRVIMFSAGCPPYIVRAAGCPPYIVRSCFVPLNTLSIIQILHICISVANVSLSSVSNF